MYNLLNKFPVQKISKGNTLKQLFNVTFRNVLPQVRGFGFNMQIYAYFGKIPGKQIPTWISKSA